MKDEHGKEIGMRIVDKVRGLLGLFPALPEATEARAAVGSIREVADWLEVCGALVPVSWGGPVPLRKCWMNHCVYNGLIYRVEVTYGAHCLSDQCVVKPGWDDLVQPVMLVPMGEVEL